MSNTIVKYLRIGGVLAGITLIVFGIIAVANGYSGRSTVQDSLAAENIVGTPDMTPEAIAGEAKEAGIPASVLPDSCSVAEATIDTGDEARCFASYMRVHTLLATGGYTYSEMGRFEAKPGTPQSALADGGGTDEEKYAVPDPKTGEYAPNEAREIWVTETALTTALNSSYMAEQTSLFGIAVGVAFILSGFGFITLSGLTLGRKTV